MKFFFCILFLFLLSSPLHAMEHSLGGQVKAGWNTTFPETSAPHVPSVPSVPYKPPLHDADLELRLNHSLVWNRASLTTQYEFTSLLGDSRSFPRPGFPSLLDDRTRLLRLSSVLKETDRTLVRHRLDRLHLTLAQGWGMVRVGRQAVTWGNGFVFNPGDLINPFAPTETERDYKVGEDMIWVQGETGSMGWEVLGAVRRDVDGKVRASASALGARVRAGAISVVAARNYEDSVAGLGGTREILEGVGRTELVWTEPDHDSGYLSAVANLDRSAVVAGKNVYGFLELHWSGIGHADAGHAFADPGLSTRISRGSLYTLGRLYAAASLDLEVHPLVRTVCTAMVNLEDGSFVLQPDLRWDFARNMDLRIGLNLYCGPKHSEFGMGADSVNGRVGWYF